MFKYPDNCKTPSKRLAFCLRYQERMHEKCIAGEITEQERAANVAIMLPYLLEERAKAETSATHPGPPSWAANKNDWNPSSKAMNLPSGLSADDKGGVYAHATRVLKLNSEGASDPRSLDDISDYCAKARVNCLHDDTWDGAIDGP